MSPKNTQRFWDNDMHKQNPEARRTATRLRFNCLDLLTFLGRVGAKSG